MTNFDRVRAWLKDANQEPKHFNAQLAAHVEEAREFFFALHCCLVEYDMAFFPHLALLMDELNTINGFIKELDGEQLLATFKAQPDDVKKLLLDGICDQEVTGNGLCYMLGFDKNLADKKVQASNDTKLLVDEHGNRYAVRNEHGKIIKPTSFIPVDLSNCIGE